MADPESFVLGAWRFSAIDHVAVLGELHIGLAERRRRDPKYDKRDHTCACQSCNPLEPSFARQIVYRSIISPVNGIRRFGIRSSEHGP
jgi:hypothetical protein